MNILRTCLFLLGAVRACGAFDLTRYPEAGEILLGTVTAEIQPIRHLRIKAPLTGLLHLRLPAPGTRVGKGTVWAEFEPARLALERRALDLAHGLLSAKEEPALRLEHARARAELDERLDELLRQAGMLRRLQDAPDLNDLYLGAETEAAARSERIRSMLALLDRQAALLREVLAYVGSARQEELEIGALRLKVDQQQLELDRRVRDNRLAMPFDGEITLVPPLPPAAEPLPVESGMDLARLQDFSRITARAIIRRTEWRLLEPTGVSLCVSTGGGELRATYVRSLSEEIFGREELVYYFAFPPAQSTAARALVGGQVSARIVAALPARARLVPKLELVLAEPALFRSAGWERAVAQLIPGARVMLVGENQVAIASGRP